MRLSRIEVQGYRSVKDAFLRLSSVNVVVGPNGCGKSNLYRALWLLHAAANGEFSHAITSEGGMESALWAGRRGKGPVRLKLKAVLEDMQYELQCGLPVPSESMFDFDPEIKTEHVWFAQDGKKSELLKRDRTTIHARDDNGKRVIFPNTVSSGESVLSELREPHRFPELSMLRQQFLNWRFYHHFRTDIDSPLRLPQTKVRTPIMRHDGIDVAAALQTIYEVGDREGLKEAIDRAFPGSKVFIGDEGGQLSLRMMMPGFQRAFDAKELSDGTLQYLCLLAALLSTRPPTLLALNEPENSIHSDLYEALGRLIADASKYSQIWITTHSRELADYILEYTGAVPIELEKIEGATRIKGQKLSEDDGDDEEDDD